MQTTIYLVEDDPSIHDFLALTLRQRPDWAMLGSSTSLAHARQHAGQAAAHVYLIDLGLPDGRGEDLLRSLSESNPAAELLVFTVFGDETRLIEAIEAGATGYVLKGCTSQELIDAIEQIQAGGAPISALLARLLLKRFRGLSPIPVSTQAPDSKFGFAQSAATAILSDRETEVLKLLAQGYVNKEIANKLFLAPSTVHSHVKNLYRKLSAHSRVQVVRIAQERGWV